jgi:hypothetical protein
MKRIGVIQRKNNGDCLFLTPVFKVQLTEVLLTVGKNEEQTE